MLNVAEVGDSDVETGAEFSPEFSPSSPLAINSFSLCFNFATI